MPKQTWLHGFIKVFLKKQVLSTPCSGAICIVCLEQFEGSFELRTSPWFTQKGSNGSALLQCFCLYGLFSARWSLKGNCYDILLMLSTNNFLFAATGNIVEGRELGC